MSDRERIPVAARCATALRGLVAAACTALTALAHAAPATTADYQAVPPFVARNAGKPNVIIALDISGSMKAVAYRDTGAGNWKTGLHDDFDPAVSYFGYFESDRKYLYDGTLGFFRADPAGDWDGNFLNWLAMRRVDVVRKVLVGGKVRDRAGEVINGQTWYVLEGQNEPYDYTFRKAYANASAYSPLADGEEVLISGGQIVRTNKPDTFVTVVSPELEVGRVTMDWTLGDPWKDIEFANTYVDPVVVATAVSYNGAQPVLARVKDVGAAIGSNGGFRIRLQEWDYLDGNHTSEDLIYIVAERGHHLVPLDGGGTLEIDAGEVTTDTTTGSVPNFYPVVFSLPFTDTPAVFAGVSSYNEVEDETPTTNGTQVVTTRTRSVSTWGFDVALQEQEANAQSHVLETIGYVALSRVTGTVAATGVPVEIASTGNVVDEQWYTIGFSTTFGDVPLFAAAAQTTDGWNTATVRFGNAVRTESAVDVQIDEEQSGDGETAHVTEEIAYLVVPGGGDFNIRVGIPDVEPTGIVQDNAGGMRFGLAVYNYDHTRTPTSIYTGNKVDGGTFYPCYPDVDLPPASRSNYDICLPTHVKSPLENIIRVIEEHPLIWGTTPIAETLYDIYGYVAQKDNARNGHPYFYDNGTEADYPGIYPSYDLGNAWDPYYYDEYGDKLPCVKTFVLHFNDGAPWDDWNDNHVQPGIPGDADGDGNYSPGSANGRGGNTEMLDDMAYYIRNTDCRADLPEHQEIISYYVYAALGEGEINNESTRKMRESAANGGFVDGDGDHEPDPPHPGNFKTYYQTFLNGGSCEPNEWDADGDCNPDTFYLADNGYELVSQLTAAFESILRRSSSGGAASVISAAANGEGALYQAVFQTSLVDGADQVAWTGDVNGLFVDDRGNMRMDDGDLTLEQPAADPYVDMCYNTADKIVRVKLSTTSDDRPDSAQTSVCSPAVFPLDLFELDYLWSGGDWLASLSDAEVQVQRPYTATSAGRYILTAIDGAGGNGLIDGDAEVVDFVPDSFDATRAGLLGAADAAEATAIVNWIRGLDQPGYRSRGISGGRTWRLGDVVYSTPTTVARPAEAFDLLYDDGSYESFVAQYKERRHMVYAGGNDGMLHAFNAGWYDAPNHRFELAPPGATAYPLGMELWAYVPYNLLPHLKYLADPAYGQATGNHVYFVDLKPRVFDARIFTPDATHPQGWGTVLVGGMRFGGGTIDADVDTSAPGSDVRTLRSSYFLLDITDPEQPPRLLLEFTHPELGFTTSVPAPFVVDGTWYLMLGSGPDATRAGITDAASTRPGHLFLLNLHTMALEPAFGTGGVLTLPDADSFVSDLVAVDYGLDYSADAVYFGTVSGSVGSWGGKLYRIQMQDNSGNPLAPGSWTPAELLDAGRPITARPSVALDSELNRWLLVGTGRFYTREDATDTSVQRFIGVKEPRLADGSFSWGTASFGAMADVTAAEVRENSAALSGVTLTPPLDEDTFYALEARMLALDPDPLDGWFRDLLPAGDRVIGEATVFGATLTHTSYRPSSAACSFEGSSRLHALNFSTGTAGPEAIIGLTGSADADGNQVIATELDLGVAPALTPSLHTGSGYDSDDQSKAYVQTSTGKTIAIEQTNRDSVRSGERSWRRLH